MNRNAGSSRPRLGDPEKRLDLSGCSSNSLIADSRGVGTILNDD
jgi:hypothetical protein